MIKVDQEIPLECLLVNVRGIRARRCPDGWVEGMMGKPAAWAAPTDRGQRGGGRVEPRRVMGWGPWVAGSPAALDISSAFTCATVAAIPAHAPDRVVSPGFRGFFYRPSVWL